MNIQKLAATVLFSTVSIVATQVTANSFACEPWSSASLQDKGHISVSVDAAELIWSNGKKVVKAVKSETFDTVSIFSDQASVYFVFGLISGPVISDISVRRVFNISMLKFSETKCSKS